ncbi:MAG: zinc chelation protein SecC [Verrucomicrobia bacterium]|nr:zinc chelation protein SecC [Verrucomicrobiota bacterium]
MKLIECPCGSGETIQACCGKWIAGKKGAPTAEALMRSRYTAYVLEDVDYLVETTLPASRTRDLAESIRDWMSQVEWQKLHVLKVEAGGRSDTEGTIEFIAEFIGPEGTDRHHECSLFKKVRGVWFYAAALQ